MEQIVDIDEADVQLAEAGKEKRNKHANNTQAKGGRGILTESMRKNMWKPGQGGNPNGRPKKKTWTEILRGVLDEPDEECIDGNQTKMEALVRKCLKLAMDGNNKVALKVLMDRLEPAPNFNVNINNNTKMSNDEMMTLLRRLESDAGGDADIIEASPEVRVLPSPQEHDRPLTQ